MNQSDFYYVLIRNRIIHKLPMNDPIKGQYIPVRLQFNIDDSIISMSIYERTCFSWFDEILTEIINKRYTKALLNKNWSYLSEYALDSNDVYKWMHRPFKACKICDNDTPDYNISPICIICEELIDYDKVMTNICRQPSAKKKWLNGDYHKMVLNMLDKLHKKHKI